MLPPPLLLFGERQAPIASSPPIFSTAGTVEDDLDWRVSVSTAARSVYRCATTTTIATGCPSSLPMQDVPARKRRAPARAHRICTPSANNHDRWQAGVHLSARQREEVDGARCACAAFEAALGRPSQHFVRSPPRARAAVHHPRHVHSIVQISGRMERRAARRAPPRAFVNANVQFQLERAFAAVRGRA